jgi:hypothetical protein
MKIKRILYQYKCSFQCQKMRIKTFKWVCPATNNKFEAMLIYFTRCVLRKLTDRFHLNQVHQIRRICIFIHDLVMLCQFSPFLNQINIAHFDECVSIKFNTTCWRSNYARQRERQTARLQTSTRRGHRMCPQPMMQLQTLINSGLRTGSGSLVREATW